MPGASSGCCMTSTTSAIPTTPIPRPRSTPPRECGSWRSADFPSRCSGPSWATPTTPAFRGIPRWPGRCSPWTSSAGFLVACALVRPSRSLQDLEVSSVKKKLKDKAFARGVSRDDVIRGAEEMGVPLDEHIAFVLAALRPHERTLGLGSA